MVSAQSLCGSTGECYYCTLAYLVPTCYLFSWRGKCTSLSHSSLLISRLQVGGPASTEPDIAKDFYVAVVDKASRTCTYVYSLAHIHVHTTHSHTIPSPHHDSPAKLALPYQQWGSFSVRRTLHTTAKLTNVTTPLFVNGAKRALSLVAEWYRLHPKAIRRGMLKGSHQVLQVSHY